MTATIAAVYWVLGGVVWITIMRLLVRRQQRYKLPPIERVPRVTTPPACDIADGTAYYFEDGCGNVLQDVWSGSDIDRRRCAAGNVRVVA